MRRIEVNLKFTMDLDTDEAGISQQLEKLSWSSVLARGLTDEEIARCKIFDVHRGTRKLTDLGEYKQPKRSERKRKNAPR